MNDEVSIKVEHVSKKYCKSLKRSMLYGLKDIGRNMLGLSSHSEKLRKSEFWAVDDVLFEVKKGETLGIIGPNGAGKTTLLKMLNGIFWTDKGKITVKGRVGALIEVGAGFHPLLTGRENVYINAAILGMIKKEVDEKFDEIVKFADIGDFLDTPVKFYSSGMFLRLGFAVAVYCEPDILLVDEVLAVGDIGFQNKCIEKIKNFQSEEKTIIFISHNMELVRNVCDTTIFLKEGKVKYKGDTTETISFYINEMNKKISEDFMKGILSKDVSAHRFGSGEIVISKVRLTDESGFEKREFKTGEKLCVELEYFAKKKIFNPSFGIAILNLKGIRIFTSLSKWQDCSPGPVEGRGICKFKLNSLPLLPGNYSILLSVRDKDDLLYYDRWENACILRIVQDDRSDRGIRGDGNIGVIYAPGKWEISEVK